MAQYSVPVVRRIQLDREPCIVQSAHDFVRYKTSKQNQYFARADRPKGLTQRPLFQIDEVLLNMILARRADEDRVSVRTFQQTVVRDPAQRDLSHGQPVLICHSADRLERFEVRLVPIPVAIVLDIKPGHNWVFADAQLRIGGRRPMRQHFEELGKAMLYSHLSLSSVGVKACTFFDLVLDGGVSACEEASAHWRIRCLVEYQ